MTMARPEYRPGSANGTSTPPGDLGRGVLPGCPLGADDPLAPLARALCRGLVVSGTTHSLLPMDWDRWSEDQGAIAAMNDSLAKILEILGFCVQPFGQGGASLVTGRRDRGRDGAAR
jgi:hypothetical protein